MVIMDKISWHTEKRRVKDLIPYHPNPRKMTKDQVEQLKRSLQKFDYCELVAIQPDNTIIAGHMRVKAMLLLGWGKQEIEVRVPNRTLSIGEMREYLIRSNKNVGDWDYDVLGNEWDVNDLHEYGFSADDLGIFLDRDNSDQEEEEKEKCSQCGQKIRKKKSSL